MTNIVRKVLHFVRVESKTAETISHIAYCGLVFAFAHGPYAYAAVPVALFALINLFDGE